MSWLHSQGELPISSASSFLFLVFLILLLFIFLLLLPLPLLVYPSNHASVLGSYNTDIPHTKGLIYS